jgi:hypothetical protein
VGLPLGWGAPLPTPAPILDTARPDLWPKAIESRSVDLRIITTELIQIIQDPRVKEPIRFEAASLLAQTKTRGDLEFLVYNISMKLDSGDNWRQASRLNERGCLNGLIRHADWSVIPVILEALGHDRTEADISAYSYVINAVTGLPMGRAIVSLKLDQAKRSGSESAARLARNLERLLEALQG